MRKIAIISCAFIIAHAILYAQVRTGADVFVSEKSAFITGKRVGLVTNHTAVLSNGMHLADAIAKMPGVKLTALFGPEHGFRGTAPAGEHIGNTVDSATGALVYSLYGAIHKPTPEMLGDVDALIFDIQDVGARFYTYLSTMLVCMEAAAEKGIPYIVLDRPNPIGGTNTEGWLREDTLKSFVGWVPVPIAHGMTLGELARMANGEGWLANGVRCSLTVIPCERWTRSMRYDETGLKWISPSPNMTSLNTAIVYPGTCLIEGTNVSEGRGTERPFEMIGAPFIDGAALAQELNSRAIPGTKWTAIRFTPRTIPGVATNPKHEGKECGGVLLEVTDRGTFKSVATGVQLLHAVKKIAPVNFQWRIRSIDILSGTTKLRTMIDAGKSAEEIIDSYQREVREFKTRAEQYFLYR